MTDLSTESGMQDLVIEPDEENFLRFANLLFRVAQDAVRVKFDKEFFPGGLQTVLNSNKSKLLELMKKKKVINQVQWDLLFPKTGNPSSKKFDVTLMICLIRNLTSIPMKNYPPSTDKSDGADLSRLKHYRNKIMHSTDGILINHTFIEWWEEISQAIIRLGGPKFKERCSIMKERKLDRKDDDIMTAIRNTNNIVPTGIRKLSDETIKEWKKETVIETRAIKRLAEMVETDDVVVAVGSSGCGKSTGIHYVALQLARKFKYDILIVYSPEEMRQYYDPDSKQVFVIDDIVGKATFDENKAQKWLDMANSITKILDSHQVKLLASCKLHLFQHRTVKNIEILAKFSCDLTSSDYCLTYNERICIANCYLTNDELSVLKDSNAFMDFDAFPVLCRCYFNQKSGNIIDFFTHPIESVHKDLNLLLTAFDQTTFATLFLFIVFNNCITESIFSDKLKIKPLLDDISDDFDLKSIFSIQVVKNEMEKLKNSYLKKHHSTYTIIHDKIFDLFVNFCGNHKFELMLRIAHTYVIRDRFVIKSLIDKQEKHEHVVTIPVEKEKDYLERLKKDVKQGYIQNVFSNYNLKDASFCSSFITEIASVVSLQEEMIFRLLLSMIDRGFCNIALTLLTREINVNRLNWDGETLLLKAVYKGYTEIVEQLLKQKADPNVSISFNSLDQVNKIYPDIVIKSTKVNRSTPQRYSPPTLPSNLPTSSIVGWPKAISMPQRMSTHRNPLEICFLESNLHYLSKIRRRSQVHSKKSYKITPLHIAALKGYTDIVRFLLIHNAEPDYDTGCHQIASPLCIASSQGYIDVVVLLLDNTLQLNVTEPKIQFLHMIEYKLSNFKRSLYLAVKKGFYDIARVLLKNKKEFDQYQNHLPLNLTDKSFNTKFYRNLLVFASMKGQDTIVKLILEKDHVIDFGKETDDSLLFKVIRENKIDIVKLLLKRNMDPCISLASGSPLCLATNLGHTEIVKILLDHKIDIDALTKNNPLPLALRNGHIEIFKLFLTNNFHDKIIDNEPYLYTATLIGNTEMVKALLMHNSDPNKCNKDNKSPLFVASSKGDIEIVQLLLDHNSDPGVCTVENKSPLFVASSNGHAEIVKILLRYKSDPNVCDENNESPLLVSSRSGQTEIVKLLLDHDSDSNKCNREKESPLFVAACKNHTDIVRLLLQNKSNPDMCDQNNQSPLFVASTLGHTEIVNILLDLYSNPNICSEHNTSPLLAALLWDVDESALSNSELKFEYDDCKFNTHNENNESSHFTALPDNYHEIVKLLLDHKSDPNLYNDNNESPLFVAASKGYTEIVKLLLDHKSDPNLRNKENESPLLCASRSCNIGIVKLLLDHNSDPNLSNENNESPLFVAACKGYTVIVKLLLDHNSDPNLRNQNNESPLFCAARSGNIEIVKLLLSHKSDPNSCNENNESPLFVASCNGYTDIVKVLLDYNCYPNICNKHNESPLFPALRSRNYNVLTILLEYKSDLNVININHESPLFIASRLGYPEIVKLLLDHESDPDLCNKDHESPICVASYSGHTEVVKVFLDHNCVDNVCRNKIMFVAVSNGHTATVQLLLDHISDASVCNDNNESLLYVASSKGYRNIVQLLLEINCDPNVCNKSGGSPLFASTVKGYVDIVKLLLEHKSDPNLCNKSDQSPLFPYSQQNYSQNEPPNLNMESDTEMCNQYDALDMFKASQISCNSKISFIDNESPMFVAAESGFSKIVKLLLDYEGDPHICNKYNESPLFVASSKGHLEVVKLLLNHNSDTKLCNEKTELPLITQQKNESTNDQKEKIFVNLYSDTNLCNSNNQSPLFAASFKGYTQIVKLLLAHDSNPNVCTKQKESPLFAASGKGHIEIVKLLLDHDGNPNLRTKDNKSPLFCAIENGHADIVALFLQYYKDPNVKSPKCSKLPFVRSKISNYTNKNTTVHK